MISPQGLDKLFWGRDHEDVNVWAKHLTMATEVRDFNDDKLFKIAKLNLRGRTKEWFKKLNLLRTYWIVLRTTIVQKFGDVDVDVDEIRIKLDVIKQEPKERVEKCFKRLGKLYQRRKIKNVE
jgi:hypothetical protein